MTEQRMPRLMESFEERLLLPLASPSLIFMTEKIANLLFPQGT